MLRLLTFCFFCVWSGKVLAADFIAKIKLSGYLSAMSFNRRTPSSQFIKKAGILQFQLENVSDLELAREYLKSHIDLKHVSYVVPNRIVRSELLTNYETISGQWFHTQINTNKAWEITLGSPSVIVAVLDTGVDYRHLELSESLLINEEEVPNNGYDDDGNGYVDDAMGYDFVTNTPDPSDQTSYYNPGQGTHLAGIIAGAGKNNIAGRGIAPHVKILPVRVLDEKGIGTILSAVRGIDYAVSRGAKVIIAGWTAQITRNDAKPLEEAISRARQRGVSVIAAAGNSGQSIDSKDIYPANYSEYDVISVSATNEMYQRPPWANYGQLSVSLSAPGENLLSSLPGNNYGRVSGSALSAGVVGGVAALMLSEQDMSPANLKAILQTSSNPIGVGTQCQCSVDAYKALIEKGDYIVPSFLTVRVGQSKKFLSSLGASDWQSSDRRIAEIDSNGLLTAKRPGKVQISLGGNSRVTSAEVSITK